MHNSVLDNSASTLTGAECIRASHTTYEMIHLNSYISSFACIMLLFYDLNYACTVFYWISTLLTISPNIWQSHTIYYSIVL